ncbi:MAG: metal-dependent transcriptional regulator [DPANN group archaeon]|nr:metal-dependent transcriptional regulator [DPANN group archaeon]
MERRSREDYLRVIHACEKELIDPSKGVQPAGVAKALRISRPSVSAMTRKLVDEGYVRARPYGNIFFTAKGRKEAARIVEKYQTIGAFLTKVLKYGPARAHEEAHRLEHAFSRESVKRLQRLIRPARQVRQDRRDL